VSVGVIGRGVASVESWTSGSSEIVFLIQNSLKFIIFILQLKTSGNGFREDPKAAEHSQSSKYSFAMGESVELMLISR
jgi:hypothetical protein